MVTKRNTVLANSSIRLLFEIKVISDLLKAEVFKRGNALYFLMLSMIVIIGCYSGENNGKGDGGLGFEDVRMYCGVGYYPAWDSECAGVEGCREIEMKKCGCHCKRCYFNKCVEVGCKEPCEIDDILQGEELDGGVGDVSDIEDIYNPYGPHFKPIPDSKVGMNLRIEGDLVIWTTIGDGVWEGIYFSRSDVCYYKISSKKKGCIGDIIYNGGIFQANLNQEGIISYDTIVRDLNYKNEIKFFNTETENKSLLYSSSTAFNYGINSKYIIYTDGTDEIEDIYYAYEIMTGETKHLNIRGCNGLPWGGKLTSNKYMVIKCDKEWHRYYLFDEDRDFSLSEYFEPYRDIGLLVEDIYDNLLLLTIGPYQPTNGDIYLFNLDTKEMIPVYTSKAPELGGRFCNRNIIMLSEARSFDSGPYKIVIYDIETKAKRYVTKNYGGWIGDCDGKYMILCPDCLGSFVGSVLYLIDLEEMGLIKDGHVVPE